MITSVYFWAAIALAVPVFWLLPAARRYPFLAAASFLVVAWHAPFSAAILAGIAGAIHAGATMDRRGRKEAATILLLAGAATAAILIGFKIAVIPGLIGGPVWGIDILLPLGISYYSFKAVHFVIEFRRGRVAAYSAADFFTYIFLFTAFTAGPIQRFDRFIEDRHADFSWAHIEIGLTRLAYGMIKQFVVIGYAIAAVNRIFDLDFYSGDLMYVFREVSTGQMWAICASAYLTLYLQFSAYTDIAIGLSRLFGIVIMENFNFPILATSIVDFWQRWHMTLTNWCRHYIFLPLLGLTRNPFAAAYGTFMIIGLWHAFSVDRLAWGLMHGTAVILYATITRRLGRSTLIGEGFVSPRIATVAGFVVTQGFMVFSMSLMITRENDLVAVVRIWGRLLGIA